MKFLLICAWIFAALSANAMAAAFPRPLLAEATVQGASVWLRDLLPADADPQLKSAAAKVSLGHAPQPGSLRGFAASQLRRAIAENPDPALKTAEFEIPDQVVVRQAGWPLDTETVRRSLTRSGLARKLDFSRLPIELPTGFTTVAPSPPLEVTAISPGPDRLRLLARIRCRDRVACGSFLAEIVLSGPVSEGRGAISSKPARTRAILPTPGPVLVEPGQMALLVIAGDGFRISQPVMPLKPAHLGELVRVSDPRTRRSWLAQVAGSRLLRMPGAIRQEESR